MQHRHFDIGQALFCCLVLIYFANFECGEYSADKSSIIFGLFGLLSIVENEVYGNLLCVFVIELDFL